MSQIEGRNSAIAEVSSSGRLFGVSFKPGDPVQEALYGWSFASYCATVTPVAAADYFFYLRNTSADPLVVTTVELTDAGAEDIIFSVGTYSTAFTETAAATHAETNIYVPTNLATSKTSITWDTDLTTGCVSIGVVNRKPIAAATRTVFDLSAEPIILGTNRVFLLSVETGGAAVTHGVVRFHHLMEPRVGGGS